MDFRQRTIFLLGLWSILLCPTNAITQFRERERTYHVLHYTISISVDERQKSVAGTVSMRVVPLKQLSAIEVDAAELKISGVTYANTNISLQHSQKAEKLFVTLPRAVKSGDTVAFAIHY